MTSVAMTALEASLVGKPVTVDMAVATSSVTQAGRVPVEVVVFVAMRQLQRMCLRIPDDVAIIGCDNQFFPPYLNSPFTTVDLHPEAHGRNAIFELIALQSGGSIVPYRQISECSLIVRENYVAGLGFQRMG